MQRLLQLFFALFVVCFSLSEGKLSQPKVVAGCAAIENRENIQWNIHSGERTIINWDAFSLNSKQSAHFFQATPGSAVLNRVVGSLPSSIDGLIYSNGKVLLINEKGILIGPNGRVNAASFIASTLDTSNDQFLKNEELLFKGASSASVVNYGKITSPLGKIALIGLAVENYGEIEAQGGKIALAAGSEVLLFPESQEHLLIRVQREDTGGEVSQEGILSALQIEVAAAGTPYSLAINSQGTVQASGVRKENGRVFLTAHEGDCHQKGTITAQEGTVHILGDRVALHANAKIDVGGQSKGGNILIGGDYKGQNSAIKNAQQTHIVKGSEIYANASDGGDGGKIIVWSDNYTTCHGKLDASGGSHYGNGGFIEVSGRGLDFQADVNLLASNGHVGELLLDPKFINITPGGGDPVAGNSLFADIPTGTANISGITLRNALNAADVTLQANTDVIFSDNVTVTNNTQRNLTVQAGRSIIIDSGFDIDIRRCNLIATINDAGAIPANRDPGLAQFSLGANSIIDTNRGGTNDGDVSITHGNFGGVSEGIIFIDTGSYIDFGSGICTLTGTASPSGGSGQRGVEIHGRVQARNGGAINITGVGSLGGGGEGDNVGVLIGTGSRIQGNGNSTTSITAIGGTGGLGGNDGLRVDNGWLDSNGTNSTTIVGNSLATTGDNNIGVSFVNTALVEVVNGSYLITGTGGNSVNGNIGVFMDSNSTVTSSSNGAITINGTGQGSGNNNVGTQINATGSISSVQGDIDITGLGAASTGSGNDGIILEGTITSTSAAAAAATITLDGTASSGTNAAGVRSSGGSGSITSVSGDIDLTGAVLATIDSNSAGINLQNFTITSTGAGANIANVTLDGTGSTGGNLSPGVVVSASSISTVDGALTLVGTAQDTSATPVGVDLSGTTFAISGLGAMGLSAVGGDFNVGQASDFDTTSGTFTMLAAESVVFANTPASTINTTSGTVTMTATNGGITLDDSCAITTVNTNTILSANTAASLGAIDVGAAQISCTALSIANGLTAGTNLTAGTAILNSTNSIGTAPATGALAIQTDLGTLQATISGAGDLVIFENDALVLNDISLSNGNIDINTGGAITQGGGTTVAVVGNAAFDTSRDGTVGTVQLTNNQATTVGTSVVAGDYLLTTSPASAISLSGSVDVGRNFTMVGTTFDRNNQTLRVAGSTTLNSLDPFQNNSNEVFPSGGGPNFNISTVTLAATGDITVNLRETQYTAANVVLPNAIVLNNAGNSISGALQVTTVDPAISTSAAVDYNLTQSAPLLLNPGQNFTINAARGLNNPPLGVNDSPYGGSTLNGNNGSNVTLNLANTFGGWVSIKDPEVATIQSGSAYSLEHINTYGDLSASSTVGTITTGANSENVRTAGGNNFIFTPGNIVVGGNISALTTGGALSGQFIVFSTSTGTLTGSGIISGDTLGLGSSGSTVGTAIQRIQTNSNNLGFVGGGDSYFEENGGAIIGGTVTGGIFDLTTVGVGDITVGTPFGFTGVQTSGVGSNISIVPNNGAINVNEQVTSSGNGNITLTAAGANIAHLATGDVSTVGGNIQVTAGGGPITMVDGTTYTTGGGDTTLSASTSIALGEIDAGVGDIFLTAMSGAITEVTAAATPNLTANRADLIATTGIGPINTAINQIEAEVTAPGNLAVTNTDALELIVWNGGAGGAVTNNGTITVVTAANNLTVTDVVQASGNNVITLTADGSVVHATTGDVSSGGGAVGVTATNGAITMADGTVYTTGGGSATLLANTDIALGLVDAGAGDIFLTATTGEITDNIAAETPNVIGSLGDFIAATGIGGADNINATLNTLEADITGTGNLALTNTTTLALNGVSTSDGTITLVTSAGDLNVNNTVTAGSANGVTLTAANGVMHTAAGDVTSSGGAVDVTATAGSITMADGTVYTTNGANATLLANTNIALGLIDAGAGDIFVTATTGAITDNIAAETPNLIGDFGDLIAATGIGAPDDINATLNSLQAGVTGIGNFALTNTTTLTLNGVSTSDGNITLVTTAGDLNVNGAVTAGGSNTVVLTGAAAVTHIAAGDVSSSGGAINVTANGGNLTMADGTIFTTGGGNSTLTASGSILLGEVNAGAGNIAATATAGSITDNSSATNLTGIQATLTAALGAGTVGTPLQTNLTQLDGNITGVGDFAINETGALSIGNITTTNGGFQVTVNGVIDQVAATTLSINDFLRVNTSSDGSIGTATILNTLPTTIGSSLVAGDYVFNVPTNTVDLSANITVGDDFIVTTTAYNDNGFTVTEGGVLLINGVDPNLSGNTINATGIPPIFDLSVATFAATGDITVNLRGDTNTFTNVQLANAVIFNNVGNAIGGTIEVTTVDPNFTAVTTQDYDLIQTAPFALNVGQNMIINAARGSSNPPLGTLDSPYGGSSLNGNTGSNINLNQNNTFGGWVSVRDPQDATVQGISNIEVEHINVYGNLTVNSAGGTLVTGSNSESVRAVGTIDFDANGAITIDGAVSSLTTGGAPSQSVSYSGASMNGSATTTATGIDMTATNTINLLTASGDLVFTAGSDVTLADNDAITVAGDTTGNITIINTNPGAITVDSVTVGTLTVTGLSGDIVSVSTNSGDVLVNEEVSATSSITLTGTSGNVTHLANGDLTTANGPINVTAGSGAITMADGTIYATGGGNATLLANTNIALGLIDTIAGNIFLTATTGNIFDNTAAATPNLIGARADFSAATGVGAGGAIHTTLNAIEADVTGTGNLAVTNTAALEITNWNGAVNGITTNDGTITVTTSGGGITVSMPVVANSANDITLTGATTVTHGASGDATTSGGNIAVTANGGAVTMADGAVFSTSSGNANVLASTDIALGEINAAAGAITLTATGGAIIDNTAAETPNLIGDLGNLIAATGIGAADNINSTLNTLRADVTAAGNLSLTNTTALIVDGVSTNNGTITLTTAAGDLNINNTVTAGSANAIVLTASGNVVHTAAGDVTTSGGTVDVTATSGAITMADGTVYTSSGGNTTFLANTNIALGLIDAGIGSVFLTATTGEITDNIAAETPNVIGGLGDFIAATGIGVGNDINATLNTLEADVTGVGNLALTNTTTLALNGVSTTDGTIDLVTSAGDLNVNNTVTAGAANVVTLTAANGVTHTATGDVTSSGGNINVTASSGDLTMADGTTYTTGGGIATLLASTNVLLGEVNAGGGNIVATATAGSITDNSSATNLTGNQATLVAALGAGTTATPLQTNLTRLDGTITGLGDFAISESGALSLGNVVTTNGGFQVATGGLLNQVAATTLNINDFLRIHTSSDGAIGSSTILNTLPTTIGNSLVAGNYIFNVPANTVDLAANITVGNNFEVTTTAYNDNGFTVTQGGVILINGVNPDLLGNTITATGVPSNFDLALATFAAAGDITVNLRNTVNNFSNVQLADAVVLNNGGNAIGGTIELTTVDPNFTGSANQDYNLVQTAPFALNPGQNMIINAARGSSNPPIGILDSPFGGSSLNGNTGSNINLNQNNTFGGWVSVRDPQDATVQGSSNISAEHINVYGNLKVDSTGGTLSTGSNAEAVRAVGTIEFDANSTLTVDGTVSSLTTVGVPSQTVSYSATSLSGTATTTATGVGMTASGTIDLETAADNLVFTAVGNVILNDMDGAIIAGDSTGGDITIASLSPGNFTIDSVTVGLLTSTGLSGGNVSVATNSGNIQVNEAVDGSGSVSLTGAAGSVSHTATGNLTVTGGPINVTAGAGAIAMADGTEYHTGGGDATLLANTNIALGLIDAGAGNVFLTATTGVITDNIASETPNVIGALGDFTAATGIGAADNINTTLSTLQADVTGIGNLAVTNTGALTLNGVSTNNGMITLVTSAGNLNVNNTVIAGSANAITLTADGSVIHSVAGDVTSSGGAIGVTAANGTITMADGSGYTSNGGNATLLANTDIALGLVDAGAGDVFLTATTGTITDNVAAETPNVIGNLGDFIAATGIGAGDDINATLNTLEADITGTGNLALTNTTTLALNGVSTSDGTITLVTSAGDLNVNNTVTAGSANGVTLTAANDVTHTAAGDVTSNGGAVNVTATAGSITMADGTVYTTNGANATLLANTNIALGLVDVGTGDVVVTATTGAITDNIAAETPNLIGDLGDLMAATGIGAGDNINATLNTLQADVSSPGDLALTNTTTLALNGVSTSDGNITLLTTAGNLNINAAVVAGGSNTVALTGAAAVNHSTAGDITTSGGAINVTASGGDLTMADGTVFTTGGGNSTLTASNDILVGEVNAGVGNLAATATAGAITNNSSATNLTGNLATLTAALGAGAIGTPLETNLTRLDGNITGVGDLVVNETSALSLGNITTSSGGLEVTLNGLLDQVAATSLNISDFLRIDTSANGAIGSSTILNTQPTDIGGSLVAGNYTFNIPTNTVDLSANITVGNNFVVTTTAYNDNGFTVTEGGVILINGIDPDLIGNTINATGVPTAFNLSLATFAPSGDITVNLRNSVNTFGNVQLADAVVLNNVGNAIGGTITVTTVDPNFTGVVMQDYDLVQVSPFTLNGGQNMIINAARGSINPPLGTLDSPYGGSSLNGNTGSNINLNQNNTFGGWVSVRDPQDATVQGISNIEVEHINVYGDLTVNSTGGALITGSNSESVRAVGTIDFDANGAMTIDGAVNSLTTVGAPSQSVSYSGALMSGSATTTATGIDMTATGGINLQTATGDLVFTAGGNVLLTENDAVTVAGDTTGSIVIATSNPGNITIDSVTVGSLTEIGLSGNTVAVTANTGDILVNEAATSVSGITLTGTGGSVIHTAAGDLSATNGPIQVTAGTGAITMVNGTTYTTGGGDATLLANTSIALGEINAVSGNISCTATGGTITDVTGSVTSQNLIGTTGTLSASSGIGTGTSSGIGNIGTDLTNLIASTTTGNIVIREVGGLNLGNIATGAGNFDLDAGGLITQSGGTTLSIVGDLLLTTDRDTTIGTVEILNSVATSLGTSQVAGNYTLTTAPLSAVQLLADLEVAGDMNMTGTTFTDNGFSVLAGGDVFFNGVDTDLSGNVINAKGIPVDFNISLATPAAVGPITINLRGFVENYNNPQFANAIILNNSGNSVSGQIDIQTVDPILTGLVQKDFNLVQTAPLNLNPGQNLIINAARGATNFPLGVMDSPYGGSTLNGGNGSNIILTQSNNLGGWVSIRDPNLASLTQSNDVALAHVNTYGNFNANSTTGGLTVGAVATETTRCAGAANTLTANTNVTISESLLALDTGGTRFGSFEITAQTGSILSTVATETQATALRAPNGTIGTTLQPFLLDSPVCAYIGGGDVTIDALDILTVGGSSSGGDTLINETAAGTLTVGAAAAGALSQTGLTNTGGAITLHTTSGAIQLDASVTAPGQTVTLLGINGAIMQSAGEVTTQNTGTLDVTADLGITGYGVDSALHTNAQTLSAVNHVSGELNIENTSANTSIVTLQNGAGGADFGRSTFFSQLGGTSVEFNALSGDGTAALLSLTGAADMTFSGNVSYGGDFIAATNNTMTAQVVTFDFQGVATLIVDQQNLTKVAGGQFINQGTFTVATDNLAIYAASGPQAPASSPVNPPNLVQLGSFSSLETWDQSKPNGLATKYETSYSAGGPNAGTGFGSNYSPGNGVFGSQVIWYKESLRPPAPKNGGLDRSALRIVRINSDASLQYFLCTWDRQTHYLIDYVCQKNAYKLPCLPEDAFDK